MHRTLMRTEDVIMINIHTHQRWAYEVFRNIADIRIDCGQKKCYGCAVAELQIGLLHFCKCDQDSKSVLLGSFLIKWSGAPPIT
jgi:hypothetical protein